MFSSPGGTGAPGGGPASPLAGGRGGGPSDYTMLIRQSATPAPPAPKVAPAPAAHPTTPKRSVPLGLLIALNVVLVLAIALVLYFVFRPTPPTAVPGEPLPAAPNAPAVTPPAAPKLPAPPTVNK